MEIDWSWWGGVIGLALIVDLIKSWLKTGSYISFGYLGRILRDRSEKQRKDRKDRIREMTEDPRVLTFWVMKSNVSFHFGTALMVGSVIFFVMGMGISEYVVWALIHLTGATTACGGMIYILQGFSINEDVHDSVFPQDARD